uniref:Odorant receptor n=1 Tax=Conogethes pinicolalis TaxID=1178461 RepID=A0A5B9GGC6_9NEOP|nr:odorant receptor 29 [Conogethes pinicolalis]
MRQRKGATCQKASLTYNLPKQLSQTINNTGITFEDDTVKWHWIASISVICLVIAEVTMVIALFDIEDEERFFECFSVLCFCFVGFLKFLSLNCNHKQWSFILSNITELEKEQISYEPPSVEYETDDESDDENETFHFPHHINSYTAQFQAVSTFLFRMYTTTLIIFVVSPFVEYAFRRILGERVEWLRVLPGWEPFANKSFVGHVINIIVEIIGSCYCVVLHVAFDLMSIGVMIFICGQFSLLRVYSENIGGTGRHWQMSKRRNERAHQRIISCHKIHVLLMNTSNELSKLLANILGVYFFLATLTLCSVAVQLNSELSSMQLVSLVQYTCATLTQLYLYCRYGDNVLHESSIGMGQGPFGAAHWCLGPRTRRELAMLGAGMMLPRYVAAGPFMRLDLPSLINVVRTAYSYYAVIRQ